MACLFEPENAELLVSSARLGLSAIDDMMGAMPPDDALKAGKMCALLRLVSGALDYGLEATSVANGRTG